MPLNYFVPQRNARQVNIIPFLPMFDLYLAKPNQDEPSCTACITLPPKLAPITPFRAFPERNQIKRPPIPELSPAT